MPHYDGLFNFTERCLYSFARKMGKQDTFYRVYQSVKSDVKDISRFRDKHAGERCFILGGGPSLLEHDLRLLKNEVTFGVNGIFLIFDKLGFQPTYYAVEDRLVYEDRFDDIRTLVSESVCFFPIQFYVPEFHKNGNNYFRAIYEFGQTDDWPNFSKNAASLVWIGGTVTYVCMQLAYYMGFTEVYLLGMDHNYNKPEDIETNGMEWKSNSDDPNHFHPDYFGKGKRWHDPQLWRMEKAYNKARKVFERSGRQIANATSGGKLEIFQRVDYDSLFS